MLHIGAERQSDNKASVSVCHRHPNCLAQRATRSALQRRKSLSCSHVTSNKTHLYLLFHYKKSSRQTSSVSVCSFAHFSPQSSSATSTVLYRGPPSLLLPHLCDRTFQPRPQVIMGYVVCLRNATKNKIKSPLFVCCFLIACAV